MASRRSTLVAASTRTSTARVSLEPSRSNSPLCSTRSSFSLAGGDRLPISSRNSVPPSAASKRPMRAPGRAGERAGLGAEQLALQQLVGQGARVDLHERPVLPARVGLDDLGQLLLADPVRAR